MFGALLWNARKEASLLLGPLFATVSVKYPEYLITPSLLSIYNNKVKFAKPLKLDEAPIRVLQWEEIIPRSIIPPLRRL